jgi:hypothetical protein
MTKRVASKVLGSRTMVQRLHCEKVLSTNAVAMARGIRTEHVDVVRAAGIGTWTKNIDDAIVDLLVETYGQSNDDNDDDNDNDDDK